MHMMHWFSENVTAALGFVFCAAADVAPLDLGRLFMASRLRAQCVAWQSRWQYGILWQCKHKAICTSLLALIQLPRCAK